MRMPLGFAAITEKYPVIAFVGLGANLGDPPRQLAAALALLKAVDEVDLLRVSAFYENPPLGPEDQPWYVNAVAKIRTRLAPEDLFRALKQIENALGRTRRERWGPRIIDLDLLLYDGEIFSTPELTVPHPEMHRRAFVLAPLAEIAPEAWHPVLKRAAAELLAELEPGHLKGLRRISGLEEKV
jgi:2-amino-4-hydroxy-6-hydroxymethyldihydropteridine diphosphokinase